MTACRLMLRRRPTYLRVVVTGRCPLACRYCHAEGDRMPMELKLRPAGLPCADLAGLFRVAARAGVRKVKLLGGEPLVRGDLPDVVRALRAAMPAGDLSLITSGAADADRLQAAFDAGLDRANLTIHGWSEAAFARRGGNGRLHVRRGRILDILLAGGRKLKVNYVYSGRHDDADLAGLLVYAAGRPMVVNVLDNLDDPTGGLAKVQAALQRVHGQWDRAEIDLDADSMDAAILHWDDGLKVEIKTRRLGDMAPWSHCETCPVRSRCGEGIFAVRTVSDGSLRLCMDRPDLTLPLADIVRRDGVEAGAAAWDRFMTEALQ